LAARPHPARNTVAEVLKLRELQHLAKIRGHEENYCAGYFTNKARFSDETKISPRKTTFPLSCSILSSYRAHFARDLLLHAVKLGASLLKLNVSVRCGFCTYFCFQRSKNGFLENLRGKHTGVFGYED